MEVRNKNLSLVVGVSKKVPDIAVNMTFSFPGIAECCLKSLLCNCSEGGKPLMKGSAEAALSYALFETIRDKLVSSPLELSKSKVSNISCRSIGNSLSISWNCQGTGSSLRKTCGLAAGCLHPHKLFSKFSENIKFLSGKGGNKEEFMYCVKKMSENIKKGVQLVAVGKINVDDKKLKDIMGVISNKVPDMENLGSGTAPSFASAEESEEYPLIKCSGVAAASVADYIRSNSGGMGVEVVNNGVIVYNMSWESKRKQLADTRRINDYVQKKYEKLGAEFPNLYAYFILTQGYANGDTVAKVIKTKQSASKLSAMIKETLK
jgi:hypothetical protein